MLILTLLRTRLISLLLSAAMLGMVCTFEDNQLSILAKEFIRQVKKDPADFKTTTMDTVTSLKYLVTQTPDSDTKKQIQKLLDRISPQIYLRQI